MYSTLITPAGMLKIDSTSLGFYGDVVQRGYLSAFKELLLTAKADIADLRKMFQVMGIKEDDIMAYLKAKGQTDGSSLEELSLKILQFVKTNSEKIFTKLKEE